MRAQQHNRAYDPARLAYRKPATAKRMSGRAWQEEIDLLRVEHNGDCIAAYLGSALVVEIYDGD